MKALEVSLADEEAEICRTVTRRLVSYDGARKEEESLEDFGESTAVL